MDEFDGYIAELYREMELELISSMKRNLALHLAEEQKTGIKYPQWQAIKLKELKRFQRENADIIGRRTKGLSKDVSEHMQSELKEGSAHEFKVYREALGQGYKSAKAVKDSFFRVDTEKVKGVINALDNDLTTANAAMFRMVNDTYRQVIYKYGFFMANGTYTYKQAYDAAIKDFLERGINCIEYKDGRRVNIADYCRMAVRTSSQRAYMVGQGEVRKRIGNPLIIITKHNTSCKLCKPFERKVLIDDVYSGGTQEDGDYMLLSQAMELGLYHPNCRHGSDTYYREREEFFEKYYKSHPELDNPLSETAADDYGEHNEAHIDNMIQRYRRLVAGSVDKENIANYQLLLDKWLDKKSAVVDKSGESGIIKAEPASKYLNSSEQLYKNALRVQPISNYEDIVIHGDKYSFEIHDKDGNPIDEYSPKELAEVLKEDPNYHGGNIRLISCEAGAEEVGAAQVLANLLGVDVMAPTDIVWVMPDGKMVIGPTEFEDTGIWKIFKPKGGSIE